MSSSRKKTRKGRPVWMDIVKKYQNPNPWKSAWQVFNTLVPFFIIYTLMVYSLRVSYALTLGLAIINAGLLTRLFIIQHDCGHGSFSSSRKFNDMLGSILGVITLTPYFHWRKQHAKHHATSGDLDFRGFGDVDTLTVSEYNALDKVGKFKYRLYRHPAVMFLITPLLVFLVMHRFAYKTKKTEKKERASVYWTNFAVLGISILVSLVIGWKAFLMIQLPITIFGSILGVYMFYVQHQFEDTYWRRHKTWSYEEAALKGSSYFRLPKVMQWFTGNIGFHHIHHLSPLIPNYLLEKAHVENEIFQNVETLTPKTSIKTMFHHLWDEQREKLISFREYRRIYKRVTINP